MIYRGAYFENAEDANSVNNFTLFLLMTGRGKEEEPKLEEKKNLNIVSLLFVWKQQSGNYFGWFQSCFARFTSKQPF